MTEELITRFFEAAALECRNRQIWGQELDDGFGYTPAYHPADDIIDLCDDFLTSTGYWYQAEVANTMDDLFGDDDFPF
jgi:hypothetical protein